jgi:hypothetical protein
MRSVAINVAANTNEPGVRGPIDADGRFEYIPIPESEPTAEPVPTYADLDLATPLPEGTLDRPVHLDPQFAGYPHCDRYTYGDEHGVKASPISELRAGDYLFFYATLSTTDGADWQPPEWGAYLIGHFRLARDAVTGETYRDLPAEERAAFETNAHVRRETFDARVLVLGDPEESTLYDLAVPFSTPTGGTEANAYVTDLSSDSGKGPWWRRPMRFDESGTEQLLAGGPEQPGL